MTITIEDILPMDKGTACATEFTYDERYVDYLMNKPERLEWRHGLIHSHNNMNVFFSGTDEKELATNAKAHNYYLSVVVNNRLDIIGKIGFIGQLEVPVKAPYYAMDENGQKYLVERVSFIHKKEKLFSYDCNISCQMPENTMDKEFMENVGKIMETKKLEIHRGNYDYGYDISQKYAEPNRMGRATSYQKAEAQYFPREATPVKKDSFDVMKETWDESIERFILLCLGYNKHYLYNLDFEDCLNDIQNCLDKKEFTQEYLTDSFFETFEEEYVEYFLTDEIEEDVVINDIDSKFSEYSIRYPFLNSLSIKIQEFTEI